jgi:hypothetical protein
VRLRIEAATAAELDQAEAAVRRLLDVGKVQGDYRNRKRRQGPERAPMLRRYLEDVTVRPAVDLAPAPAMLFGYEQGSGVKPSAHQVGAARRFLDQAAADGRPVAVAAIEIAREILDHEHDVEPARARVCRGAICLSDPCTFQVAGECTR